MSNYKEFLRLIIDDGILTAKRRHGESDHISKEKLFGKEIGFDACRDRFPHQIVAILSETQQDIAVRYKNWELRPDYVTGNTRQRDLCKVEAIEWVLQVLGAALGHRLGVNITKEAFEKANELDLRVNSKQVSDMTAPPSLDMR